MTKTVELDVAQATLPEIIAALKPDEKVVIVQNHKPVAQLSIPKPERKPRQAGNCKGMIKIVSEDDEHLKDFEEYMY